MPRAQPRRRHRQLGRHCWREHTRGTGWKGRRRTTGRRPLPALRAGPADVVALTPRRSTDPILCCHSRLHSAAVPATVPTQLPGRTGILQQSSRRTKRFSRWTRKCRFFGGAVSETWRRRKDARLIGARPEASCKIVRQSTLRRLHGFNRRFQLLFCRQHSLALQHGVADFLRQVLVVLEKLLGVLPALAK